ncbi:Aste57867_5832 [Aphanomyces stellatus]|uniref:Mitochondrial fission process protein 1 n=1 Tax=Aphanomyces stellatus TaxID=120398 RepID=A0A485KGW9_9STRA|nr:hypothetical protein As57867_005818 [Aphanomyces stellatus]VFT82855.1 Aste57867_5832 [Aphanomyces stellatus]
MRRWRRHVCPKFSPHAKLGVTTPRGGLVRQNRLREIAPAYVCVSQMPSAADWLATTMGCPHPGDHLAKHIMTADDARNSFASPDIYRVGGAHLVGESFRPLYPQVAIALYGVAGAFVLHSAYEDWSVSSTSCLREARKKARTFSASEAAGLCESHSFSADVDQVHAVCVAVDTFIKHSLASIAIPGYIVNRVVRDHLGGLYIGSIVLQVAAATHASKQVLTRPTLLKWTPVGAGIVVLPLIVRPIDWCVEFAMDKTTRAWSKEYLDRMIE